MADDFIVEEESSNRTFLYAVIGMGAVLVIGIIAIVLLSVLGGRNGEADAIAEANATTAAQNAAIASTKAARETIAAYTPTATRVPPTALPTKIPTFTPAPPTFTPTPVAQTAEPSATPESGESAGGPTTATPEVTPTALTGSGELPAGGLGMWGVAAAAAVLVAVIALARRLRPAV